VLDANRDARIDLGGGAVLDVYAAPAPGVSIGYGEQWIQLR